MAENKKTDGKKTIDWDLIEIDYRAGVKSLRQMGEEYGVSHVMINKKAKAQGWTRDLAAKIAAKAEEKVTKAAVTAEVTAQKAVTEAEVVEANADVQFRIRMEHRKDIGRTRNLFRSLIEELEVASDREGQELIKRLIALVNEPDPNEDEIDAKRRADRMRKQLGQLLGGAERIDSAKRLTEMLEKLVRMEREAFGIDNSKGGEGGYEELLRRIANQEST